MKHAWRLVGAVLALALPLSVSGDINTASLVWDEIAMEDGGTHSVPLNTERPTYVPTNQDVFDVVGDLYKIDNEGNRQFIESFRSGPSYDDPDDPSDGDELFAWAETGDYQVDILELSAPVPFFIEAIREWLAALLFADVAYAQFGEPTLLSTIHFTIVDANAVPAEPDPAIIIPGILGSEQHNGEWIIDPILHTYDDLIATLDANGYTREVDLFTFPYNWRKSNVETALLLKEKIDDVKEICECDKVDLVAHSMGGLVARQYIQSDAYDGDVDQLIFLGTPHLGAPKAYLMWEAGEGEPTGLFNAVLTRMLDQEAREEGYSSLFSYIHDSPVLSVQELLPIYDYIFDGVQLRDYPNNYPTNPFLESLKSDVAELLNSGVRISNFVGENGFNDTLTAVSVTNANTYLPQWEHGYPVGFYEEIGNLGLERGSGDETVPLPSASFIQSNLVISPNGHGKLPDAEKAEVYKILRDEDPLTLVDNIDFPNLKLLFIKIFSPADLLVVGPDGKKIGKDFSGLEINEILNAFYTGFNTDTEFITILNPLDGEYEIYTQGTGSGPYTVEANFITNATTTEASITGYTVQGIVSELNLGIENGGITPDALHIVVTYDSTLSDIERLYGVGYVHFGIYKSLKAQLLVAKKAPPVVAKRLLQNMLKQLKGYRDRFITEQGYQILKADIEQLIIN